MITAVKKSSEVWGGADNAWLAIWATSSDD
jgi:hypothetical protein